MRISACTILIPVVLLSSVVSAGVVAQETPDMQRRNQEFRAREAAKPPQDTSYKNTKEYQGATPEQQKNADKAIDKANNAVQQIKNCKWVECRAHHGYDYCIQQPGCSN
jgi:hypothetical protein